MCGICGVIDRVGHTEQYKAIVDDMLACLKHRGPDGSGVAAGENYALGHVRLSIIDIDAGHQPMWCPEKRYCMVYNGEIYNYIELRQHLTRQGVSFATASDTEVLLQLMVREGTDALQKVNGMFAFALYDTQEKALLLCRDHIGSKPLYYTFKPGRGLAFASEIKALLKLPGFNARVNPSALHEYMVFQFCFGEHTMFADVNKLEPGCFLRLNADGRMVKERWHSNHVEIDTYHTEEYFLDSLLMLLQESVQQQLHSDMPIGAYLSGGLDSSTVATLAARNYEGLQCFNGRFLESPAYDESHYAKAVADKIGAILHIVEPGAQDFVDWMPSIIYALDEPVAGVGVVPQFLVAQAARQHVKVVLGGSGGDEIFGGYARYMVAYLEQALRGAIFETHNEGTFVLTLQSIIPNLPVLQQYTPMMQTLFRQGLFESLDKRYFRLVDRSPDLMPMLTDDMHNSIDFERIVAAYSQVFSSGNHQSSINRMLNFDQQTLLPALLQIEDRASMHFSMESRAPFLTPKLLNFAASIPPTIKIKNGKLKYILHQAMRNLLPQEVLARKDKMGFPVPLIEWMRGGPVREYVSDIMLSDTARQRGIFTETALRQMVDGTNLRQLWGALCVELWFRTFID